MHDKYGLGQDIEQLKWVSTFFFSLL